MTMNTLSDVCRIENIYNTTIEIYTGMLSLKSIICITQKTACQQRRRSSQDLRRRNRVLQQPYHPPQQHRWYGVISSVFDYPKQKNSHLHTTKRNHFSILLYNPLVDSKKSKSNLYSNSIQNSQSIILPYHHHHQQQQSRYITSYLPEFIQSFTIWGGSGYILKVLHTTLYIPYWFCFATLSIGVRTILFPLVLYSAQTSARFAKIAPDVQFQLVLFQKDLQHYRQMKASIQQILYLMRMNMKTLSATYKINQVNPLTVFLSPLLQLPIFYYISIDMRKIVNGLDPYLAQSLVENGVAWIPDLTEPDPWFGLPIIAGVLLYGNMEVALGKRTMAGEVTAKADTAILFKDLFQSLAVFMPCFTAQLPAGVQIYIVTSFCFTLVQSILMRTESFRLLVGLPSLLTKPSPGRFTTEMMELKLLEQKAKEIRGDGPILGTGVLIHGWEISFPGKYRPTTIQGSNKHNNNNTNSDASTPIIPFRIQTKIATLDSQVPVDSKLLSNPMLSGPYIHGISAPLWQLQQQQQQKEASDMDVTTNETNNDVIDINDMTNNNDNNSIRREYIAQYSDDVMDKANRGIIPFDKEQPTIIDIPIVKGVPYKPLSKNLANNKQRKPKQVKSKKRR